MNAMDCVRAMEAAINDASGFGEVYTAVLRLIAEFVPYGTCTRLKLVSVSPALFIRSSDSRIKSNQRY